MARRIRESRKTVSDHQIERSLIAVIPALPRVFKKLSAKVEKFDGSHPRAFLLEVEETFRPIGQNIKCNEHKLKPLFIRLFGRFTAKALVRQFAFTFIKLAKQTAASDKRYSLMLKLMHEIDQQIPFASLMVASDYVDARAPGYADQKAFFVAQSTAMNFYKRAEKASGEERATLALIAHARTVDLLYEPYLIALWFFSYIKVGKPLPKHRPDLGAMVDVIVDRLPEYHGLVERDAVWMRNSAVHNPQEYENDDSIWMWDRKHPRKRIRVADLMAMTESLFVISTHTIQSVSQLYFFRDCMLNTGLLDMAADCIAYAVADDQDRLTKAELAAKTHAESLFTPVIEFANNLQSRHRKSSASFSHSE